MFEAKIKALFTHVASFKFTYLLFATIALMALLYTFPSRDKGISKTLMAVAHPAPGMTLLATLKGSTVSTAADQETLSIEASRLASTRLDNLTVCVDAPGFITDPASPCTGVDVFDKSGTAAAPPLTTFTLHPARSTGNYKVLLTLSWQRYVPNDPVPPKAGKPAVAPAVPPVKIDCSKTAGSCHAVSEKMLLSLGPVEITTDRWGRFVQRLSRFVKDLTLPVVLVWIGNWLTTASKKREEENQIAQILLPKVMGLAGSYYLPMTLSAGKIAKLLEDPAVSENEVVFHLLSFFLVARVLKEKEGGVFFKNLLAEEVFAKAFRVLRDVTLKEAGGESAFAKCLNDFARWAPAARWPRLAEQPSTKSSRWEVLEAWVRALAADRKDALVYLYGSLSAVMRFESNAPYARWYSDPQPLKLPGKSAPSAEVFGVEFKEDLNTCISTLNRYKQGK